MTAGAVGYSRRRFVGLTAIAAVTWGCYSALIGIGAGAWLHDHTLVAVGVGVVGGLAIGLRRRLGPAQAHPPPPGPSSPSAAERCAWPTSRTAPGGRADRPLRSQDAHDPTPPPNDPVSPRHFAHDCAYSLTVSTSRSALPCLIRHPRGCAAAWAEAGRGRDGTGVRDVGGRPRAARCAPAGPRRVQRRPDAGGAGRDAHRDRRRRLPTASPRRSSRTWAWWPPARPAARAPRTPTPPRRARCRTDFVPGQRRRLRRRTAPCRTRPGRGSR